MRASTVLVCSLLPVFSCQTHFLHNVSLNNPTHHHHLPPPVPRTTCPPLLVNRGRHLDKQMMGILENGTVLWGSFQSFLSGEGGELHTMSEDGEQWGEARGRWKTQGEPALKNTGMRLGRCSWPGSLMVPPIVAVIQGLPSLIYICEPCHSHLQAFVSLRTVRVSDTRAVRAFRIALSAQ